MNNGMTNHTMCMHDIAVYSEMVLIGFVSYRFILNSIRFVARKVYSCITYYEVGLEPFKIFFVF